jgi:hypothetical protein
LFEEKYLEPVSNNLYMAQISFKLDFQNDGAYNGIMEKLRWKMFIKTVAKKYFCLEHITIMETEFPKIKKKILR